MRDMREVLLAGVHSEAEVEWVNSCHRLVDLGVRDQNIWIYERVATRLKLHPHEAVAQMANKVAEQHGAGLAGVKLAPGTS